MSTSDCVKHDDPEPEPIVTTDTKIGNGVQSYDSVDEMLESWKARMTELADEIKVYGGSCVFAFGLYDPLEDSKPGTTHMLFDYRGNYHECLGMCVDLNDLMKR